MARYALVVGISEYKHLPSPLSKTLGDAEAVANLLRSHGDFQEVTLLNTPKLIKADLFAQLNRLLSEQATGSEVLIYYTGHGVLVEDCGVKQGYLAPSDCKATKESVTDGVPFVGLNNLIARSPLSSLVMFLDCCHSGALLQAIAESFTAFNKTDKDYLLISACRDFEQAAAMKKEAHSIFTGALLEALSESRQNDEGKINSGSLFGFISDRLKQKQQEPRQLGYGRAMEIVNYRQVASPKVIDETCPYVGLNAFDELTAQWFFGRETAFKRLMSKIEQSPFVFVVGVSGSGKSSLVKAKLIPEMKRRGHRILLMKPWSNPIQKLKDVFAEILEETGTDVFEFEQCIDTDGLLAAIADLPKPILLVIDQFEEVFTVCSQVAERRKFMQMLVDVAQTQTADFWAEFVVVATMRIDFLADCTYANLDAIVNEQMVVISGMSEDELRDAIAKPAETQGYQLSDGLLDAILQDIEAEPNCLPLLEFALQELWENRNRQQRRLSLEGYRQMERLKGALNRHADRLYGQQSASGQEWMRRIFLKLVRTGKDAKDTRQRERRQVILDLARDDGNARKEIERILKSLEGKSGRLLVASEENGVAIVDLAHEALMDGWKRFAEWRLEDRDLRRLGDRVEDCYKEWQEKGKSEDYFLPNGLMLEVREQLPSMEVLLSAAARDYYQLSERNATDKVAFIERNLTEIKLREEAIRILNLPPTRRINASVQTIKNTGESLEKFDQQVLAPIQSLLRSNVELVREVQCWLGHGPGVNSVAFSPDGKQIVSGSDDNTIRLWDLQGNQIGQPFQGHGSAVNSVAFSPDGKQIVFGSDDKNIRLWDLQGNQIGQAFQGHWSAVNSVAFSPDGKQIVSGSDDKNIRLWDLQGNQIGQAFQGHENGVNSVAFSPDGKQIVSGSNDNTIRLWDLQGNQIGQAFQGHGSAVNSVAFSPDGKQIVSGSNDNTIRLWDLQGNQIGQPFQGHEDWVNSVAFSPDGKQIVSGSDDKTIRLWDLQGNQIGQPFQGHEDWVNSVAFSPDGKQIVSGSDDKNIRLWDLQGNQIGQAFQGHEYGVSSVAFSLDGKQIVSGSNDNTIRLWRGGDWHDWLEVCCNRLRYHSVFKDPADDLARSACEVCRKYVWDKEKTK
jgi:WD40 repeat protein/energy-coupling factor transporter ATP-binding protein EcfA2